MFCPSKTRLEIKTRKTQKLKLSKFFLFSSSKAKKNLNFNKKSCAKYYTFFPLFIFFTSYFRSNLYCCYKCVFLLYVAFSAGVNYRRFGSCFRCAGPAGLYVHLKITAIKLTSTLANTFT